MGIAVVVVLVILYRVFMATAEGVSDSARSRAFTLSFLVCVGLFISILVKGW